MQISSKGNTLIDLVENFQSCIIKIQKTSEIHSQYRYLSQTLQLPTNKSLNFKTLSPSQEQQAEETEESSSFAKIAGTVAFIALGAALVAMVLRKQSL